MLRISFAPVIAVVAVLSACATLPDDPEARAEMEVANDPLEPTNRAIFEMNMYLDGNIMAPVAEAYRDNAPDWLRSALHGVLNNLQEPFVAGNDLLQGNPHAAADSLGRFFVNSTFGLLGAQDVVAQNGGPVGHKNDLGVTMGVWGIEQGPYIMLPLLGPSSLRDGTGRIAEYWANPTTAVLGASGLATVNQARMGMGALDTRTENIDLLNDIRRSSIDEYAAIRSLYWQTRAAAVRHPVQQPTVQSDVGGMEMRASPGSVEFVESQPQ